MLNYYEVNINSPVNNEYSKFKKLFSDLYVVRAYDRLFDSLTDLKKKEQRIASYIRHYPNSYVAFWEIVSDYKRYDYNPIYLENLELFSTEIKKLTSSKDLKINLKARSQLTLAGHFLI